MVRLLQRKYLVLLGRIRRARLLPGGLELPAVNEME
jgi:hypothetical protein